MGNKRKFIKIPPKVILEISEKNQHIPTLYSHSFLPLREVFWLRLKLIHRLILMTNVGQSSCFDFGGGGGVFLPSLSNTFDQVDCGDKFCKEASSIVALYELENVRTHEVDLLSFSAKGKKYQAVIAADVLEHFKSLKEPIEKIKELIHEDGVLITSLPSEDGLYVFLRKLFGIKKPADHYHSAKQVEKFIEDQGFVRFKSIYVPFYIPLLQLFHITAWKIK